MIESTSGPTEALPLDAAEQLVDLARLNLAQWLSIPVEMIELVNVEAVEWPDASLGCPQEGMTYTQVITPGYFILLEAFSQLFPYHTDLDEKVFLCETTSTPGYPTLPPAKDADDRTPWQPVDPLPTVQP